MKALLLITICMISIYYANSQTYPVIAEFKPYVGTNSTFQCVAKIQPILSALSEDEQKLMYNAFVQSKGNSTSDNDLKNCFDRDVIKKGLKDSVKADAKNSGKLLTDFSVKTRNSMGCINSVFKSLKVKDSTSKSYTQSLNDLLQTQVSVNQCSSEFVKTMFNSLGNRKRYLLLNNSDMLSLGRIVNNFIVDFPWTQDDVNSITPAFIKYAYCFSGLPNSIIQNINDALVTLSEDPACQQSSLLRFLQTSNDAALTTSPLTTTPLTTTPLTTTPLTTTPLTTTPLTTDLSNNTILVANSTIVDIANNITLVANSTLSDIANNITVLTNSTSDNSTISNNTNTNVVTFKPYYDEIVTKGKSLVKVNLPLQTKQFLNKLLEEMSTKNGTLYDEVNKALKYAKDNADSRFKTIAIVVLAKTQWNYLKEVINGISSSKTCSNSWVTKLSLKKDGNKSNLVCETDKSVCETFSVDFPQFSEMNMIFGCSSSGNYFAVANAISNVGNMKYFEFYSGNNEGNDDNKRCSQEISNLGSMKRLLQTLPIAIGDPAPLLTTVINNINNTVSSLNSTVVDNVTNALNTTLSNITNALNSTISNITVPSILNNITVPSILNNITTIVTNNNNNTNNRPSDDEKKSNSCLPTIKKTCLDAFNNACKSSKLDETLKSLEPSSISVSLPIVCQGLDAVNPDYVPCFKWIAKNLIKNSLVVDINKVNNLQEIVNTNQNTLRLLQSSDDIVIKSEDPLKNNPDVQLPADLYTITSSDIVVDGSTEASTASVTDLANDVDKNSNTTEVKPNSSGFISISMIIMVIAFIF